MSDPITPADLSRELGVSQRSIRDFLRNKHGLLQTRFEKRWLLSDEQAAEVRDFFLSKY
jgi:DNA-binding GntR family transcriptional regulator